MGNTQPGTQTQAAAPATGAPKFQRILDQYETIEAVQEALRDAGLESSQLIVGLDFTKSNHWSGRRTFGNRCLHSLSDVVNPYEQALSIIARTLAPFDDDNFIPCYGFGDLTTKDRAVFSFFPDNRPAVGLEGAVARYRQIVPHVDLSGPTSFAPIVNQAIQIVQESGNDFHILVIIADGQVSQSCRKETVDAIVAASRLPISIIMVGVGDGPWEEMVNFDDKLPTRLFDNFQFVEFEKIMRRGAVYGEDHARKEALFAMHALMEVPDQYKLIQKLELMRRNREPVKLDPGSLACLPPPPRVLQADSDFTHVDLLTG